MVMGKLAGSSPGRAPVFQQWSFDTIFGNAKVPVVQGKLVLATEQKTLIEWHFTGAAKSWSAGLTGTAAGTGVMSHSGSIGLRLLADRTGLISALSAASVSPGFMPVHDRDQILVDIAVMLASVGEAIADIEVLGHQREVLGPVAAAPTAWRALDEMTPARLKKIAKARAGPASGCGPSPGRFRHRRPPGLILVMLWGSILTRRWSAPIREMESAAPSFTDGFGFHPLAAWCDNTWELPAMRLRPGNAAANTAADHTAVLEEAFVQIPVRHRKRLLVRADGAGATHGLLDWLTEQDARRGKSVEYSVGLPSNKAVREAITAVPKDVWTRASNADADVGEGGDVAELTGLPQLGKWSAGVRVIVRRERPHPGAQLDLLEEADGWRYQAFATNTAAGQLQFLEARHRAHARVQDRIRHAKDTRQHRPPSRDFAIGIAWCAAASIAVALIAWLWMLTLSGNLAKAEPKRLRYRLLHVPAHIAHTGRRRRSRMPKT